MPIHVVKESKHYLQCKNLRCGAGCPINTSIPDMIQLFHENDLEVAGEVFLKNNPTSVICSLVCDHGKQCVEHCVLGIKSVPAAIDYPANPNVYNLGHTLVVIGAGNSAMDVARTALWIGGKQVADEMDGYLQRLAAKQGAPSKEGARP